MEELIEDVERIIDVYKQNIERQKKYHDYPFTNNPDHYFRLMMLQKAIEVWSNCLEKIQKNWKQLDIQYSKDLTVAADEVYRRNPTQQIKKYTILVHVPKSIKEHIVNAPEKFPKTIKFLNSRVETDEQYLLRHLPVIISQMNKYNKKITSLENIKTFSPMYRKSTLEVDEKLTKRLNNLLKKDEHSV
ncbi:hypothetical protein ACXFAU_26085 [Paenibacillus glucanolyticus]